MARSDVPLWRGAPVGQDKRRKGGAFGHRLRPAETSRLRAAYADPPYVGCGGLYKGQEVDHERLLAGLEEEFPDGWALSASANSLGYLLSLAPLGTRVGVWLKPFYGFKPGVAPSYAWEPVLYIGGRRRARLDGGPTDWLIANPSMGGTHGRHTGPAYDVLGQKPPPFSRWVFRLLNLRPEDDFVDLFAGSGAVMRAWSHYRADLRPEQFELMAEHG